MLIPLSYSDHTHAHKIRWETYHEDVDKFALFLRSGDFNERLTAIQKSHLSQKINKRGFFYSNQQSENGKKGGRVRSEAKRVGMRSKLSVRNVAVFAARMKWVHTSGAVVDLEPGFSTGRFARLLKQCFSFS